MMLKAAEKNLCKYSTKVFTIAGLGVLVSVFSTALSPSIQAMEYDQSPMLDERVENGELPPVEERLPENPRVVDPPDRVGEYGGTLTVATVGGGSSSDVLTSKLASFFTFGPKVEKVISDLAKDYEISDDYKTYTIHLRKDLKWSDGNKYTAKDFMFWWNDIMLNEDLTPVFPARYKVKDQRAEAIKVDKYTVQLQFAAPNPMFTLWFHGWANSAPARAPEHYLKQFHEKYNSDASKVAKKNNFDSWTNYFKNRRRNPGWNANFDTPRLNAWIPVKVRPSYKLYERNPYFHQVDTEGNQLPYIDRLLVLRCNSPRIALGKMAFGQIDLAAATVNLEDFTLLKSFEKESGLSVNLLQRLRGAEFLFAFNLSCPDPVKREMFRDVRFRRAVSLAIDREEIDNVVYQGKAEPRQASVLPIAPYFKEEHAEAYATRDLDKANKLLNEMGLEWDKGRNNRIRPDGKPLAINFEYWAGEGPKTSIVELIRDHLAEVGIDLNPKPQNAGFNRSRQRAGKTDIYSWHMDSPTKLYRRCKLFPTWGGFHGVPSGPWWKWLDTDGEDGKKPPEKIIDWYEIGQKWKMATDLDRRHELGEKMLDVQAEQLYWIGTVGRSPTPVIYDESLRNVPKDGYWGWQLDFWRAYNTPQFFFSDPEKRKRLMVEP